MKEIDLIHALDTLKPTPGIEYRLMQKCTTASSQHSPPLRRSAFLVTASFLAVVLLLVGVPHPRDLPTQSASANWLGGLSLAVSAQGSTSSDLADDLTVLLPSSGCFHTSIGANGEETLDAMTAIDFVVDGDEIESISYSAKYGTLFCEYNTYDHDEEGNFLWSEVSFSLPLSSPYLSDIASLCSPTREELIKLLERLHTAGELTTIYDDLYNAEFAATQGKTGVALAQAQEYYLQKCAEPIDFSSFILSSQIGSGTFWEDYLIISIINPEHPPKKPANGRTVTAESGDTVSWYIQGDSWRGEKLFGQPLDEIDFTNIYDEISLTVRYTNGTAKQAIIFLECQADGSLSVSLQKI